MPVPKRKRSRARRDSRHANRALKVKVFTKCQQCQHPLPTHQACAECGYYKGAKVLRTKDERSELRVITRKAKADAKASNQSEGSEKA